MIVLLCVTGVSSAIADTSKTVTVTNNTGYTMTQFYVSASSSSGWNTTQNLLAGQTLAPGQQTTISINDGSGNCLYDLMAVLFGAAQYAYSYSVDMCDGGTWTISGQ